MADLIAQGPDIQCRWRRELPTGRRLVLGRSSGTWAVSWDRKISRHHAEIIWNGKALLVRRLESARNPIFQGGVELTEIRLELGDTFTIGDTSFQLVQDKVRFEQSGPSLVQQGSYSFQELEQMKFRSPDERIEILAQLPTAISSATRDVELFIKLCNLLFLGTPHADAVAVIGSVTGGESGSLKVMHWDRRPHHKGDFCPSECVLTEALKRGESVAHVWSRLAPSTDSEAEDDTLATPSVSVEWAICTPIPGEQTATLALYLSGREVPGGQQAGGVRNGIDMTDDLKFTSIVASYLGALRQAARLAKTRSVLSHCLSPMIIERLPEDDPEVVLAPRLVDVCLLLCRLRSRDDWKNPNQNESLFEVLERISQVLRLMTYHVLDHGGVMASRNRESAIALWGWPLQQADGVGLAVQAALGLKTQLDANSHRSGHPLLGFETNLALTMGEGLVGKLGTTEQVEIGVFGEPVSQAEYLRAVGAALRLPIVLDAKTAQAAREQIPPAVVRYRQVMKVMWPESDRPETIYELLPSFSEFPDLADDHLHYLDLAHQSFEAGRWTDALLSLRRVPPEDRVKDFMTSYIAKYDGISPPDWTGAISWSDALNPSRSIGHAGRR